MVNNLTQVLLIAVICFVTVTVAIHQLGYYYTAAASTTATTTTTTTTSLRLLGLLLLLLLLRRRRRRRRYYYYYYYYYYLKAEFGMMFGMFCRTGTPNGSPTCQAVDFIGFSIRTCVVS